MSHYILNERIKIDYWSEFKAVISEVKAIAETVRTENRRVNKDITTSIVVRKIKDIIAPLSRIFNYRYSDDTLRGFLNSAVQGLQRLALELESFFQTRFVAQFRRLADTLVSFLSEGEGVQLNLFDAEKYHVPKAAKLKLPGFWRWWNYRFINRLGFSNPYKNWKIDYTQLSIPFGRVQAQAAKKRFISAYFDFPAEEATKSQETTEVDVANSSKDTLTSAQPDLASLGLRKLRRLASSLSIPQKIDGKDRPKASFIDELEKMLSSDRLAVVNAIAAL